MQPSNTTSGGRRNIRRSPERLQNLFHQHDIITVTNGGYFCFRLKVLSTQAPP